MLHDELVPVRCVIDGLRLKCPSGHQHERNSLNSFRSEFITTMQQIRTAWNAAAFSGSPDHSLKRYFNFHLEGIREILDTLHLKDETFGQKCLITRGLLDLIQYQRQYFGDYFNFKAVAPYAFCETMATLTSEAAQNIIDRIANASINPALAACLMAYFKKIDFTAPNIRYNYSALFYFEHFLKELYTLFSEETAPDLNEAVGAKLTELNFNALDFFCYKKQVIKEAIAHLTPGAQLKYLNDDIEILALQPEKMPVYDPRFPSLALMLKGWLVEEAALVRELYFNNTNLTEKVSLNLSVAHLACFTRLFFEENIYNSPALTPIFKFIAGHYQTKRQTRISTGSLSKEYYSISQVTAAVVRDKLLKMVARLNREYFPVMAAVSAAALLYSMLR